MELSSRNLTSKPPLDGNKTHGDGLRKKRSNEAIAKNKSANSYESKYTLIDISEEKMRNFVSGQLRYFDCRTEFNEMLYYESYEIHNPTED